MKERISGYHGAWVNYTSKGVLATIEMTPTFAG